MDVSIFRAVFEASPNPYMVLDREFREAERESLLEQQRFLTESIPQHVWTADAAGQLTTVNMRVLDYFGVGADRVVGSGWHRGIRMAQFVHPQDVARSVERCRIRERRHGLPRRFATSHRNGVRTSNSLWLTCMIRDTHPSASCEEPPR